MSTTPHPPIDTSYTTRAAFWLDGRWVWHRWTHDEGSSHAAIRAKARELKAEAWDIGNADHERTRDYNFHTR